jgi:hypothetical protein
MFFPTLKLPLNSLTDEVGALFALLQDGIHTVQGALWKAARDLLEIDLFSAHFANIDDITNCYKGYFIRYHLFTSSRLLISSIYRKREMDMTKQLTLGTAKIFNRDGLWIVNWMNLGSFLVGEQMFGNINYALRFCRERGLPVISCETGA